MFLEVFYMNCKVNKFLGILIIFFLGIVGTIAHASLKLPQNLNLSTHSAFKEILFVADDVVGWEDIYRLTPLSVKKYILDSRKDFFSQVVSVLKNEKNINAIHLITHGKKGKILFGKQRIDERDLFIHTKDLEKIGKSLAPGGDIFLYGCNIAKGKGILYLDTFARFTHADVAGSSNITGALGDWKLEVIAKNGKIDMQTYRYYLPYTNLGFWSEFKNVAEGVKNKTLAISIGAVSAFEAGAGVAAKFVTSTVEGGATLVLMATDLGLRTKFWLYDVTKSKLLFNSEEEYKKYLDLHNKYFKIAYDAISNARRAIDREIENRLMLSSVNIYMMAAAQWDSKPYEASFYSTMDEFAQENPFMGKVLTSYSSTAVDWGPAVFSLAKAGVLHGPKYFGMLKDTLKKGAEKLKNTFKNPRPVLEEIKMQLEVTKKKIDEYVSNIVTPVNGKKKNIARLFTNVRIQHNYYMEMFNNVFKKIKKTIKVPKSQITESFLKAAGLTRKQYEVLTKVAKKLNIEIVIRKSNASSVEKLKKGFVNLGKNVKAKVAPKPLWLKAKTASIEDMFIHQKILEKMGKANSPQDMARYMKQYEESFNGVTAVFEPISKVTDEIVDGYVEYLKGYLSKSFKHQDLDEYWDLVKKTNNGVAPKNKDELLALMQDENFMKRFKANAKAKLIDRIDNQKKNFQEFKDYQRPDASETFLPTEDLKAGERIEIDDLGRVVKVDKNGNKTLFASDADLMTLVDNKTGKFLDQDKLLEFENLLQKEAKAAGIEHGSIFSMKTRQFIKGSEEYEKFATWIERLKSKYTNRIFESIKNGEDISFPSELVRDDIFKQEIDILVHKYKRGALNDKMLNEKIREKIEQRLIARYWYGVKNKYTREGFKDKSLVILSGNGDLALGALQYNPKITLYDVALEAFQDLKNNLKFFNTIKKAFSSPYANAAAGISEDIIHDRSSQNTDTNEQSIECRELFPGHSFGEWRNSRNFAAITKDDELIAWGNMAATAWLEDAKYKIGNRKIVDIFSNEEAFAALLGDGDVVAWGNGFYGGKIDYDHDGEVDELHNVKKVYSTTRAFAALSNDGSVVAWGNDPSGAGLLDIDHDHTLDKLNNVKEIYSNENAFAALKSDGSVVAWGDEKTGGIIDINHDGISDRLDNVKKIYSTRCAFAALKNDGSVITWGLKSCGGFLAKPIENVKEIFATERAFTALKNDGSVVAWGDKYRGGFLDIDDDGKTDYLTNIKTIASNNGAFAAIKKDNELVVWGDGLYGGSHGYSSYFARIKSKYGLDGSKSIKNIYATRASFAALLNDGSVISWGRHNQGNMFHFENDVKSIYTNSDAYAVIKIDGKVNVWGALSTGGKLDEELDDVREIKTTNDGFAAILTNGDVVSWGYKKAKFFNIAKVYPDLCHKPFALNPATQQKEENIEVTFYDDSKTLEDTITEQRTTYSINIKLKKPLNRPVTFKLEINPYSTSALYKDDYDIDIGEVIFQPGETQKQLSFNLFDDDIYEGDRTVAFDVVQKDDEMNRIHFYLHIKDDEPEPLPYLSGIDGIFNEGETAEVGFRLNKPASETIVLGCKAVDKFAEYYAQKGQDYKVGNDEYLAVLTFKPGEVAKKITIETIDDNQHEPKEYLTIQCEDITDGREHVIIDPKISAAHLVIVDNDIDWDYLWDLVSNNKVVKAVISKAALVPTLSAATKVGQAILNRIPEDVKSKIANDLSKYVVALKFNQPLEKAGDPDGYKVQATTMTRALDTIKVVDAMLDPRDPSVVLLTVDSPISPNATLKVAYEPESEEDAITIPGVPPKLTQESVVENKVVVEEVENLDTLENSINSSNITENSENDTDSHQQSQTESSEATNDTNIENEQNSNGDTNDDATNSFENTDDLGNIVGPVLGGSDCEDGYELYNGECRLSSAIALANRVLPIKGYFAYYGNQDNYDPFAWVYLSSSGRIFAKLNGMDPNTGKLKWWILRDYFDYVYHDEQTNEIVIGSIVRSPNEILAMMENRRVEVKGYFSYYGDRNNYDPFAWVYVSRTGGLIAKLEGMNSNGTLKWQIINWDEIGKRELEYVNIDLEDGMLYFGPLSGNNSETPLLPPLN